MNFNRKTILTPFILFTSLFLFLFFSCKKENLCDCFKRTGKIIKEERALKGFSKILINDNLNAFIIQDSVFNVIVEAGEHIAPLIKTRIEGNTLVCENDNRCNWTRSYNQPLNIYIHLPVIDSIESRSTGNITGLTTITTPVLYLQTKGSGDVELTIDSKELWTAMYGVSDMILHGKTNNHQCDIGGTGFLKAENLVTQYTYLHTFTIGICSIYVTNWVDCNIDQKGDVYCYGNPNQANVKYTHTGRFYLR